MQIQKVDVNSLSYDPANARTHSERNIEAIKGSLRKFGQQKPIVVDGNGVVIAGNGTLQAAKELGWHHIEMVRTNLTGAEAIAFALADNRTSELAEWNDDVLGKQLQGLFEDGFDIGEIGFDDLDLNENTGGGGKTDDDDVPEVEENIFGVKRGDIWQLGEHRLMCGDSTSKEDVDRLMAGEKADMVFTDPPYGLGGYKGRGKNTGKPVQNDEKNPTEFYRCFPKAPEMYVWGCFKNLNDIDFEPRDVIVWRKNNFGMGKGYRGQYEVCFYKGGFSGSDSDVWDVAKDIKYEHPTQKPVALAERAINNSEPRNVLDVFLGSGSTLIACEKTNRKCYGMEIDPHYCSVIIKRWQDYTGKEAKKLTAPAV